MPILPIFSQARVRHTTGRKAFKFNAVVWNAQNKAQETPVERSSHTALVRDQSTPFSNVDLFMALATCCKLFHNIMHGVPA